MNTLVGIDEAGRGPLAGPVSVGVVSVPSSFDVLLEFPGVTDSKKLTEKKRDVIFEMLETRVLKGDIFFSVGISDAKYIDTYGIVPAIKNALCTALYKINPDKSHTKILLDGSLYAPDEYKNQKTIIKGDLTEPVISLASIAAKVTRDKIMYEMAKQYPEYGFDRHKGYGTVFHRDAIKKYGKCEIHRNSFIHI